MEKGKIDINTIIGFLLIGAIFLYFSYFNPSTPPENTETVPTADTVQPAAAPASKASTEPGNESSNASANAGSGDTLSGMDTTAQVQRTGPFAEAKEKNNETYTLENKRVKLTIAAKGGQIVKARLKEFQTYDSLPLHLIQHNARMGFPLSGEPNLHTADLYFKLKKSQGNYLELQLPIGQGGITYRYELPDSSYMLQWQVASEGLQNYLPSPSQMQFSLQTFRQEKNLDNEMRNTAIEYLTTEDQDVDDIQSDSYKEEQERGVGWVAYKQQFFSTILWNKKGDFAFAKMTSNAMPESDRLTKSFNSTLNLPAQNGLNLDLGMYLGPNKYTILKSYDQKFDELIPMGWGIFGWINKGLVITVFHWLEDSGLSYGIIILVIVLLIKTILFPLTYTSYRSMAKMRVLKPEIDELNEKYKDKDAMKKQQATMELYSKAGVNPLGGCIPMFLQMPVLIAMFHFFPASIELRQEGFLWAHDLSTYDSIATLPFTIPFYGNHVSLFTLLMAVSTIIYTYMNQQLTGQNQQYPQMKYIVYLMPIVFLGVFNNYAAALSYYYFLSNVVTFGQQFAIRAFLDDEKIHAKIQEKKKKPGKQNRLMRRMQEIQQEQNRQTRRSKK